MFGDYGKEHIMRLKRTENGDHQCNKIPRKEDIKATGGMNGLDQGERYFIL